MVWNHVRVRILGPGLWALICPGLLNRGVGQKLWYPQCPFFSGWGDQSSLAGKIPYSCPACRWERGIVNAYVFQRAHYRGVFYFW